MPAPDQNRIERKALTSIGKPIHCGATPDPTEEREELDEIAINTFLDTLVEIALAVARRRQQQNQ